MSYTPTVWKSGDIVSSVKLNKIETELSALDEGLASVGSDIDDVETSLAVLEPTATSSDVGKALKVKTVFDGKVTEYEFGEVGSSDAAPVIVDTATGAIASFPDGAGGMPFRKVVAEIEPVQDLHGYDSPWPAGGGKNLFYPTPRTVTSNGVTYTANADGSVTLTGTATGDESFSLLPGDTNAFPTPLAILATGGVAGVNVIIGSVISSVNGTYQTSSTVQKNATSIKVSSGTVTNCTIKIQVENSSTIPTQWTPYENICPISGHTGVDVTRTGKNLCKSVIQGFPNQSSHTIRIDNDTESGVFYAVEGQTYVRSASIASNRAIIAHVNTDNVVSGTPYTEIETSDETTWTATWTGWTVWCYYSTKNTDIEASLQIELASTATDYEPYNGDSYSVTWEDEVFGGSAEVVEGKRIVDRSVYTFTGQEYFGSFNVDTNTTRVSLTGERVPNIIKPNNTSVCQIMCDKLPTFAPDYIYSNDVQGISENKNLVSNGLWIRINNSSLSETTMSGVQAYLAANQITVCYYIAAPIETDITPTPITALQGQNNVWASTGDATVNYPADTKLYIDKKIAAAVAALS